MLDDLVPLIAAIHADPTQLVFVAAGAGGPALQALLGVAGASNTLLEATIPYGRRAFVDYLGRAPAQFVSEPTALRLAGRALARAQLLVEADRPLLGVACSAAIASNRPKKGAHRAHVATWQNGLAIVQTLILEKGARSRAAEDALVSRLLLRALAEALDLAPPPLALGNGDSLTRAVHDQRPAAAALLRGERPYVGVLADGRLRLSGVAPEVLLSGAFNPLHAGHLGLADEAAAFLNRPVAFELSAVNVDKPPLPASDALARLAQFAGSRPVYLTGAPTFLDKSRLFPGCTFVVGYDTAVRILQPRYYAGGTAAALLAALAEMDAAGTRFLVAGRRDGSGRFLTGADLAPPPAWAHLFRSLPAERFRSDLSSTALRAAGERGSR
jgi:nicotinamide mononucleotide (NMN) deamidase PncC